MRSTVLSFAALVLALAPRAPLHAQGGRIVAAVVEAATGAPIEGAEVVLPELRRSAWADANGEATLGALPPGDHRVRVRHLGHVSAELTLRVGERPVGATFILERRVATLDTVRIVGRYVPVDAPLAFRQRQALGIGRFITDRDLGREGTRDFATVMATRLPGVGVGTRGGRTCVVRNQPGSAPLMSTGSIINGSAQARADDCSTLPCPIRVFLDDMEITDDLWLVKTWDVAGVEYYTEVSAPAQYRTGKTSCGILVIWSKK